jgi:hypothetical protein
VSFGVLEFGGLDEALESRPRLPLTKQKKERKNSEASFFLPSNISDFIVRLSPTTYSKFHPLKEYSLS